MNKLEMAHDYAMAYIKEAFKDDLDCECIHSMIAKEAWAYADAMQAEEDKREDKTRPAVLQEEWQPDWSQAPDNYKWAGVTADSKGNITGSVFFISKPEICETTVYSYYIDGSDSILNDDSFGYTGKWQDSLRKRHE